MFIVLLSNCIRIRHYARSAIAEGGDRVAIGCSWRLKRCGQAVELVVIGCGSISDLSEDVVRIYRLYLLAWLGRLCVLCMHM